MKRNSIILTFLAVFLHFGGILLGQTCTSNNGFTTCVYTSNGTFTVPAGVTQVTVEAWGAGGAGGLRATNGFTGGGGGGSYTSRTISVNPSDELNVYVADGGLPIGTAINDALFTNPHGANSLVANGNNILATAVGGNGVFRNIVTGGSGGNSNKSFGFVTTAQSFSYAGGRYTFQLVDMRSWFKIESFTVSLDGSPSGGIVMGLYAGNLANRLIGDLIVQSNVETATNGLNTLPVDFSTLNSSYSQLLPPGRYWIGCVSENATSRHYTSSSQDLGTFSRFQGTSGYIWNAGNMIQNTSSISTTAYTGAYYMLINVELSPYDTKWPGGAGANGGFGTQAGGGGGGAGTNEAGGDGGSSSGAGTAGLGGADFGGDGGVGTSANGAKNDGNTYGGGGSGTRRSSGGPFTGGAGGSGLVRITYNDCTNLPAIYNLTGGGAVCPGHTAPIGIDGSQSTAEYQLKRDGNDVGSPISGTGNAIHFGDVDIAGTYTVEASGASFCGTSTMTGSAVIELLDGPTNLTVGAAPAPYCAPGSVQLSANADKVPSTLVSENFESGTFPSGWTNLTNSTPSWNIFSPTLACAGLNASMNGNYFMAVCGNTSCFSPACDINLFSPVFDFTDNDNIEVSFSQRYQGGGGSQARFYYRINNGSWVQIGSWTTSFSIQTFGSGVIPGFDGNNVQFRWQYTASSTTNAGWAIDDFLITGNAPPPVVWSGGPIVSGETSFNPTVNPNTPTTYTITASHNGCDATADVLVIAHEPSVPPTSIDAIGIPYCIGGTVDLSLQDGSLSDGASWEWFTSSCGGTPFATGTSVSVSPTSNTNYFVRASTGSVCPESSCESTSISVPSASNNLAGDGDQTNCYVPEDSWVHFFDDGKLIASVKANGEPIGEVEGLAFVATNPHLVNSCTEPNNSSFETAALARSVVLRKPDGSVLNLTSGNSVDVRIYFSDAEWNAYLAAASTSGSQDDTPPNGLADMQVTKFSPAIALTEDGNPHNNCGGAGTLTNHSADDFGTTFSLANNTFAGDHFIQVNVTSFSEFYPMYSAINSALPVTLTSFHAQCEDPVIFLKWQTQSEYNASHFSVQSSRDGIHWTTLGDVAAAGTSSITTNYEFTAKNNGALTYFRLIQVDLDGASKIYGPISSSCDLHESSVVIYPNPAESGEFIKLEIQSAQRYTDALIQILDMMGRVIYSKKIDLESGTSQIPLDTKYINAGAYVVHISTKDYTFDVARFIVR